MRTLKPRQANRLAQGLASRHSGDQSTEVLTPGAPHGGPCAESHRELLSEQTARLGSRPGLRPGQSTLGATDTALASRPGKRSVLEV